MIVTIRNDLLSTFYFLLSTCYFLLATFYSLLPQGSQRGWKPTKGSCSGFSSALRSPSLTGKSGINHKLLVLISCPSFVFKGLFLTETDVSVADTTWSNNSPKPSGDKLICKSRLSEGKTNIGFCSPVSTLIATKYGCSWYSSPGNNWVNKQ